MKCSKCGANMQDGTLYCPVCGQEVQWVPDYSTLETLMQQHQIKKSIPDPEEIRRKQEESTYYCSGICYLCTAPGIDCFYH